jgi:DNA-directed RNA polymerase specialized sigma24 family protein
MPRFELDRSGWESLFKTALTSARRVLGFRDPEAYDVAQEALTTILEREATFDPDRGTLAGWINVIAYREAINVVRHRRRNLTFERVPERPCTDPFPEEDRALLLENLLRINAENRILFILAYELRPLEGADELDAHIRRFGVPYDPAVVDSDRASLARRARLSYANLNQILCRVRARINRRHGPGSAS